MGRKSAKKSAEQRNMNRKSALKSAKGNMSGKSANKVPVKKKKTTKLKI